MKLSLLLAIMFACASVVCGEESALLPVTRQETLQAIGVYLRTQGLPEDQLPNASDLELPATIPAASERTLRVASVCWDAQMERAAFRMECTDIGACLPFLVYAGMSQARFRTLHSSENAGISPACSPHTGVRTGKAARPEIVVRPGDRAAVVFRGNQLRLSEQVSCLERGAAGDIIRVRNFDGALFRARVVASGLLEAITQ